jgi:hypothetical protein
LPGACSSQTVKATDELTGKVKYPVKAINVLKAHGKSAHESVLLNGYAINLARAAQGMPKRVTNARIACLDMNLQKARMMMGVQVLVNDPKELEKVSWGWSWARGPDYVQSAGTRQEERRELYMYAIRITPGCTAPSKL